MLDAPDRWKKHLGSRRRRVLRLLLAAPVLLAVAPLEASPPNARAPRVIARFDVGLLAIPNVSAWGGGGGIEIPLGGTGAGFDGAGGIELGAEVRLWRWIALDAGVGRYRPDLVVDRDRGPDQRVDHRSASVDLQTTRFGLVISPRKWRSGPTRAAIGVLLSKAKISGVPESLGVVVDETDSGVAVDARAEFLFSKSGHWGVGVALTFDDLGPRFVDTETGDTGSLQVSGMFLRVGLRGAW